MPSWLDDIDVALSETGVDPEAQLRQRQRAMDTSNAVLRQRAQSGMAVNPATTEAIINQVRGNTGLLPLDDLRGRPDADGRVMKSTVRAVADELASAAELALGKTAGRPLALVRGAAFQRGEGRVADTLIPPDWDLFR